ncbi:MAG TPA: hypothetical protein VKV15_27240 [Bryobacteraceae bacterium]|nr:hypothetical protein [Bryobacteraceae bacterium]
MFEQSLVVDTGHNSPEPTGGRLRTWGPPHFAQRIYSDVEQHRSRGLDLCGVGVLALLPLIYNEVLPMVQAVALRLPSPAVPPPAAMKANPAPAHASSLVQRIFNQFEGHGFEAPRRIPDKISILIDQPAAPELPAAGATGPDVAGGIRDSLIGACRAHLRHR